MFSRSEKFHIKQEFWTAFGQYMKPVPFANDEKNNWVNYKTGIKDVYFRMNASDNGATVSIEICHRDAAMQLLFFEQFVALKNLLHETLGEEWKWEPNTTNENNLICCIISASLPDINIYNKNHWPQFISFFKPRIIALDAFWSNAKYTFESLLY